MMTTVFLARLGLEDDADERQVRRAYARELKLIDQERDLEGFQHLRACYEAALDWVARKHEQSGSDVGNTLAPDDQVMPPVVHQTQDDPRLLAGVVFEAFRDSMATLVALPDRKSRDDVLRIAPWMAALREALADPRLLHLEARAAFEYQIADLLTDGWQPGHELLLPAAIAVFAWEDDYDAIERLGYAGMVLDAALYQRDLFQSQNILARTRQRTMLDMLRQPVPPKDRVIRRHIGHLRMLRDHFPELLYMVAPRHMVNQWLERHPDSAPAPFGVSDSRFDEPRFSWTDFVPGTIAVLLFYFVSFSPTGSFFGSSHERTADQAHRYSERVDETKRVFHRLPKPIYEDEPLTAERIEAIRQGIDYHPGHGAPTEEQIAEFRVLLDADGSILDIHKLKIPPDRAYALAVEKAIRATGPFPPKTARIFRIGFHTDARGRSVVQPDADGSVPPLAGERMADIHRRIDYRPGKDAAPGDQHVRFEVLLDDAGVIRRMSRVLAIGDPAYADSVERAIRLNAPLTPVKAKSFYIDFRTTLVRRSSVPSAPLEKLADRSSATLAMPAQDP